MVTLELIPGELVKTLEAASGGQIPQSRIVTPHSPHREPHSMSTDASDSAPYGAPGQPKQILGVTTAGGETPMDELRSRMIDYRLPREVQFTPVPHDPYDPTRFAHIPMPNFISTIGGQRPEDAQQELRAQEQTRQAEIAKLVEERKLRDQFAAAVVPKALELAMNTVEGDEDAASLAAEMAYEVADAMLVVRAKRQGAEA
jgi:hypothetical protein